MNFVESFAVCYSGAIMRKTWKEVGLGTLSLLAIILVIVATHPVLPHLPHMVGGILLALSLLATFIACARWIERRTPSELDLHHFLPEMAIGLVIGFGLFAISMTILWAIGVYHPAGAGTTYASRARPGRGASRWRPRRNRVPRTALPLEFEDFGDMGSPAVYSGAIRRGARFQSRGNRRQFARDRHRSRRFAGCGLCRHGTVVVADWAAYWLEFYRGVNLQHVGIGK